MTAVSEQTLVTLVGGFTVTLEGLELAWNLEDRGLDINVLDGDVLEVLPVDRLQPVDAVAIRKHKAELIALCRHVARM